MSNFKCIECESHNTTIEDFNYVGDWSHTTIICLDCGNKTTKYYDIKYTNTYNFYKESQKERVA